MSASRPSKILRISRSDGKDQNLAVILHIQPTAATIPLNVSIVATDGSEGYGLTLKDSKTKALKDSSSEQSDDEWKAVLRAVLLADASPEEIQLLSNIDLTAVVKKDSISISIREDIGGIRRRLGVLSLTPEDVEIELWEWLDRVCREKGDAEARCHKAEQAAAETQLRLEKLERQLLELSTAKKKHEDALIFRFQHLLNEKKKKIRELQGGKTPSLSRRAEETEETDEEENIAEPEIQEPTRKTKASKISKTVTGRKRKQVEKEASDEMSLDEDPDDTDGAMVNIKMEDMDPDAEDRQTTPDTTDDEEEEEL